MTISVIIPARNEQPTLGPLVRALRDRLPEAEVVVVDDGSTDGTAAVAAQAGARVVRHGTSLGNGAAVKSGARAARGEVLVFMDADGQHDPEDVARLVRRLDDGYDMVVGARTRRMHAGVAKYLANTLYNVLASWMTGIRISDLTSGFRAVRASVFRQFLSLLPNGFSYPTTITMALLRAGHGVTYEPVNVRQRTGEQKSHIRPLRDGGRFFLIIFRVGTLYSPLKIFFPVSLFFFSSGVAYCGYTLGMYARFTNFGALLLITSVLVFLIGLVSEQITNLMYSARRDD